MTHRNRWNLAIIFALGGAQAAMAQVDPIEVPGEVIYIEGKAPRYNPLRDEFFLERDRYRDLDERRPPVNRPGDNETSRVLDRRGSASPESSGKAFESPNAKKSNGVLAEGVLSSQEAVLIGWQAGLVEFEKILSSDPDEAANADFLKVIQAQLKEKLIGEISRLSNVPGAGTAFALLKGLEQELDRAQKASQSASLRDFFVEHHRAISVMIQEIKYRRDDFLHAVEVTGAQKGPQPKVMRWELIDALDKLDRNVQASEPKTVFWSLCETWVRQSKVGRGESAFLLINVNEDLSLRDATLVAPYAQQMVEQLVKDAPNGQLDIYRMNVPRRVVMWPQGKPVPRGIVLISETGGHELHPSFGGSGEVSKAVRSKGLPAATKSQLKGRDEPY